MADIVKVVAFDEAKMTVDVQPLTHYPDEDTFQTKPQVLAVPVSMVYGGGFSFCFASPYLQPLLYAGFISTEVFQAPLGLPVCFPFTTINFPFRVADWIATASAGPTW